MQFVYHPQAGAAVLNIDTRAYEHIFKVRRISVGEKLFWRNLVDECLYQYQITQIGKKEAILELNETRIMPIVPSKILHVGWSIIDPKIIEKSLPMLNELGVTTLTFFYADFSQKQHKLDFERMERILINSSQQCGRSNQMRVEYLPTLQHFIEKYPKSVVIDFSESVLSHENNIDSVIIGPEGGFSEKERLFFKKMVVFGLKCNTILRSETAVIATVSKILA